MRELYIIIGASLSEPHINGTAMREFYIIYYWGEPERAPHRRGERSQSIYYYWGEPERAPHKRYSYARILYVIVISRARGMYGIYCTEARGREAARGLSAINGLY